MNKLKTGQLVVTCGIFEKMEEDDVFYYFVCDSFLRYLKHDWGDMGEEDKKENDDALKQEKRIFAVYKQPKTGLKIWIVTEWDRSITTILFPEEY